MPGVDVGVTDTAQASGVIGVDVALRPSADQTTTITADPGTTGTTLAVTANVKFPSTNGFFVRVDNEYMFVTAGAGTNSWTVTRNVSPPSIASGSPGVVHSIGATVSLMVGVQRVSPILERVTTFQGLVAGFRTLGTAAVPQNLFTIENGAGSPVLVAVKKLSIEMDATAVLTTVAPEFVTTRPTGLPTGGTQMTKTGGYDTSLASNASVILRSGTASDGGTATAITATAGGTRLYHQFMMRQPTAVGQVLPDDWNCIPLQCYDDPIILRANEALLVQIIGTAASNAATNHYVAKVVWEEFRLP